MRKYYVILFCCMIGLGHFSFASGDNVLQETKVTGNVTSDQSEGLPGVTVMVKGTTNGTVSDIDGNYSINTSPDATLVFSFVGYKTQEVPVNGRTVVDVTLEVDVSALDEVVVVGYGEQKKETLTGAITTVEPDRLEDIPTGNLSQTLIGKLAGIQVNRNGTGIPGTPSPLVIRDESASGMQRQVLYVIDGVIYSDDAQNTGPSGSEIFNRLDASEIESISILKDAAASVYGARGAGGVVLVTTKKGQIGKPRVNYNGSVGIGQPTQIPEMLSGEEHALLWNEILDIRKSLGARPAQSDYFNDDQLAVIRERNHNWLDGLYRNAATYRHSVNVSGGAEDVRYFMSGNYYYESGNYDNLWFKRYSVRANLEYDITSDLMASVGLNFSEGNRKNPNYDPGSGNTGEGVLRDWYKRPLTAPRWIPPTHNGLPVNNGSWNPYGLLDSDNYKTSASNNTNITARVNYKLPFLEGLNLSSLLSYNINTSTGTTFGQDYLTYNFYNLKGGFISENPGTILVSNSEGLRESFEKGNNYQYNISVNYANSFGEHNVKATLVYEQSDGSSRGFNAQKSIADIRGFDYFWAFSNNGMIVNGVYSALGRWGVIGRFNYDYQGKYLFESSFRSESSSKFAPDERKGIFPAVSTGWVISEESFFNDNVDFIDFLKLRVSVGLVGNDNLRPFEWKPAFNAGETGPVFGVGEGNLSNAIIARNDAFIVPSRTWSKTRTHNIGIDLSAFDNTVDFTAEYYYAFTYDAFQANTANASFVLGSVKPPAENYKQSFSEGVEFQVSYKNNIGRDINYSLDANFTRRHSRPLRLYQNPLVIGSWRDELKNDDSNQPGFIALGIIRTDEDLERVKAMYPTIDGKPIEKGMIYYKDIGGPDYSSEPDGVLDGNDRTVIAEYTTPPYSYGFGMNFSWKGWRLNASFGGVFGHKEFIQKDEQLVDENAGLVVTQTASTFAWWGDYWTEDNVDAKYPRPAAYGYEGEHSTFWMRDGHTLRLNDMSISYRMPEDLIKRWSMISNLRVYASATNVWTIISPFDYKDPAVSRAFDYPLVRTVSLGLSFSL